MACALHGHRPSHAAAAVVLVSAVRTAEGVVDGSLDASVLFPGQLSRNFEGVVIDPGIFSSVVFLDDSGCRDASGAEVGVVIVGRPAAVEVEQIGRAHV
mgnify:CR=1 FL=1